MNFPSIASIDHISPRIVAAEVKRTLSGIPGAKQKECFTDLESRPHSQKGDPQRFFKQIFSYSLLFSIGPVFNYLNRLKLRSIKLLEKKSKVGMIDRCTP